MRILISILQKGDEVIERGDFDYGEPELSGIAEQIYDCKEKKRSLELELNSEKFHCDYIPKRKNLVEHEAVLRLVYIIPLTAMILCTVVLMLILLSDRSTFLGEGGLATGLFLLFATLFTVGGGYLDAKLLMREVQMFNLIFSDTFQEDEEISKRKITALEEEIVFWDEKAEELIKKQQQLILEKKQEKRL